ncbi:hypothetical protein L7F22_015181 [Adiantum nelumboides]|nr:hypothetical protein [Adiantum nelumboides]
MALSASNDRARMHDPHYGPDLLGFQSGSSSPLFVAPNSGSRGRSRVRAQYDDFSVSAYLHVLRPQVLALNPTPASSIQRTVQNRTPNPAVFKRSETMPVRVLERPASPPMAFHGFKTVIQVSPIHTGPMQNGSADFCFGVPHSRVGCLRACKAHSCIGIVHNGFYGSMDSIFVTHAIQGKL